MEFSVNFYLLFVKIQYLSKDGVADIHPLAGKGQTSVRFPHQATVGKG